MRPTCDLDFSAVSWSPRRPICCSRRFGQLPEGAASLDVYGGGVAYHGDDSYQARLDPLLKQSGVRVMGPVPHTDVADALAWSTCW